MRAFYRVGALSSTGQAESCADNEHPLATRYSNSELPTPADGQLNWEVSGSSSE